MTYDGHLNTSYERIQHSEYHKYAKKWLKAFPRNQIHFANGDNLIQNPVLELRKIESFLGLRHYISEENFVFNSTKGFFCWKLWDDTEKCESKGKGRPHPKVDEGLKETIVEYFKPHNKLFFDMIGDNFGWPT